MCEHCINLLRYAMGYRACLRGNSVACIWDDCEDFEPTDEYVSELNGD